PAPAGRLRPPPLACQGGEVSFRFPLVVPPRYIPGCPLGGVSAGSGVAADPDAGPDASRISPPVLLPGFPNPVRLTMSVDIDPAGLPLAGIRCSLHAPAGEGATCAPRGRGLPRTATQLSGCGPASGWTGTSSCGWRLPTASG